MSSRVMQTLEQFAPEVEIDSIDEAFLNLAGIGREQLPELAAGIRRSPPGMRLAGAIPGHCTFHGSTARK